MTDGQTELCEQIARERMTMWTTFDIETAPLRDEELQAICPPFSEKSVKFGRTTDPEKRRAIAEKARASHFSDFAEKAALCPSTGRVLIVALCTANTGDVTFLEGPELELLEMFWLTTRAHKRSSCKMAGVNIYDFDLPFLIRRSWILGCPVPSFVIDLLSKWTNYDSMFVDLRLCWQCGNRQATSNFDHIGRAMGTGGKSAGDHGKHFAELYAKDRAAALEYAANDVRQPAAWLYKMGLASGPVPGFINPSTITQEQPSSDHQPAFDDI